TTILWRCACAEDAAARVAGVNRGLEGLACDVFNQLVHIAGKLGDPILERAVEFVLADEITHVRMGSKWLTKLTEGDPERRRQAPARAARPRPGLGGGERPRRRLHGRSRGTGGAAADRGAAGRRLPSAQASPPGELPRPSGTGESRLRAADAPDSRGLHR